MKACIVAIALFVVALISLALGWLADRIERWFADEVDEDVKRTFDTFTPNDWPSW